MLASSTEGRNRTEVGKEFLDPHPVGKEFQAPPAVGKEFSESPQVKVDRWPGGPASENLRPDPTGYLADCYAEAKRTGVRDLGQIVQVWLGERFVDFGPDAPRVQVTGDGKLLIPDPLLSLPPRKVLLDRNGKVWENTENLKPGQLRWLNANSQVKQIQPRLEAFASGAWKAKGQPHYYVLQPLTQILIRTLGTDTHFYYVTFLPDPEGRRAMLLYDAHSRNLVIYCGERYRLT